MKFSVVKTKLPSVSNILLAISSSILLILAFPDLELWFLAYVALIPLFFAIERSKESATKSFLIGWIFGTAFIFGSCYWMAYAPTHYGGVPAIISYLLLLSAALVVGTFYGLFGTLFSIVLKRFGVWGILSAPVLWTVVEFLRFNLTGNNWNAIAYSQAFGGIKDWASIGGIYLVGFLTVSSSSLLLTAFLYRREKLNLYEGKDLKALERGKPLFIAIIILFLVVNLSKQFIFYKPVSPPFDSSSNTSVVAIQANVPMSGLKYEDWEHLRERHIQLSENGLKELENKGLRAKDKGHTIVIFPESPMNFAYTQDREFQQFLREFTARNNVSVLFNAAEPTETEGYYNSAVMVNEQGRKIAQYDKIHLVPFGEFVPFPKSLAAYIPTVAGNFEFGTNYNLMPFGEVKAGMMICFESHFPTLSRRLVSDGADVLVEITNDGYLGNTAILRQHLANTVFRAVETNRPVLRVTNVGITAYVNEKGEVIEPSQAYTEDTRLWTVSKSDGSKTFYVKYGDWFAWLCLIASLGLLFLSFRKRKEL